MNGIFLQGGGAKGAFQAGVIYGLCKKGVKFQVITGTSIGAVNGYYLYTGNLEALKDLYTKNSENQGIIKNAKITKVIDNTYVIDKLRNLKSVNKDVRKFFVNYVHINDIGTLEDKKVNIVEQKKDDALNFIKYSSLLPYVFEDNEPVEDIELLIKKFNSANIFEEFKSMVTKGMYNGYNLDGGILNNNFLQPFLCDEISDKIEKIYMLPLSNQFEIPGYIKEKYEDGQIITIKRQKEFKNWDTLNFNGDYLRELFFQGLGTVNNL
ncbi:patatin-like phospholipase family protein [Haloimpatiens sp. FM7315]|uniref:patatin-like phospholipase family protein n=1 Tax=Haloimpatiens sp. FM7315 TaxID=3298609 RepID=UPI003709C931